MPLTSYVATVSHTGRHPNPRSHRGSHAQNRARQGAVWWRRTSTAIGWPTVSLGSWIATSLLITIDTADTCSGSNEAKVAQPHVGHASCRLTRRVLPDAGSAPRPLSALSAPEPVIDSAIRPAGAASLRKSAEACQK